MPSGDILARRTRVLLVEDSDTDAVLIQAHLKKGGPEVIVQREDRLESGIRKIDQGGIDVILLDLNLPDSAGLDTFRAVHARAGRIPIIVLSGQDNVDLATHAVAQGAQDYLPKAEANRSSLARSVRYAIERTRWQRAEQELNAAGEIQRRLFPQQAPAIAGFDIYGHCEPAHSAGGDYFDYFQMCDGGWGIVVADVSGHGIGSSLIMSETRAILRTLARTYTNVGDILTRANDVLSEDLHHNVFVALLLVHLLPEQKRVHYASAGHPAVLLDEFGKIKARINSADPPLGVLEHRQFATLGDLCIDEHETLLLYTDGIVEAFDEQEEQFGEARLIDIVASSMDRSSREVVQEIFESVRAHASETSHLDDRTAVILKATDVS